MNSSSFEALTFIISIIVAIVFAETVKSKIRNKEEFSGVAWGLLNGVFGTGILWVVIAHASINKEIEKVKSKKYKTFAEEQMKTFVRTYGICLLVWIIIFLIGLAVSSH